MSFEIHCFLHEKVDLLLVVTNDHANKYQERMEYVLWTSDNWGAFVFVTEQDNQHSRSAPGNKRKKQNYWATIPSLYNIIE